MKKNLDGRRYGREANKACMPHDSQHLSANNK